MSDTKINVDPNIVDYAKNHTKKETLLYNNRLLGFYLNPSQKRIDEYEVNRNWILEFFDIVNKLDIKNIAKNLDLYGSSILIMALQKQYKSVIYAKKSIPSAGSPCRPSGEIAAGLNISKVIFHRNKEVTIFTQHGNLRFF